MDGATDIAGERWHTLVAGAGPAGMLAALELASAGCKVLLIDAGPDAPERERTDCESGVGGAGLFSDGKLCLSLDVGGHLEESTTDEDRAELLARIEAVFLALLDGRVAPPAEPAALDTLAAGAREAGLDFKYYPVLHIGTDRCRDVILRLRALLEDRGVRIAAGTALEGLDVDAATGDKVARLRLADGSSVGVRAGHVVLALGKVGAAREAAICRSLGIGVATQPLYLGVRYEASAGSVASLFEVTKDPKYSLTFADGSKIKTHCASDHGEVIALRYGGLPLAGGHNYSDRRTGRSGFSVLWNGLPTDDGYETALDLMRRAHEATGGRLLVQRVADYRRSRPSRPQDLRGLDLSCPDSVAGDLRSVLPAAYFERLDAFLDRLERVLPAVRDETAVLYAPAIEWWMQRVEVENRFMETAVEGVYACGDGSGWSQGIVHAAATGVLAATGILRGPASEQRVAALSGTA